VSGLILVLAGLGAAGLLLYAVQDRLIFYPEKLPGHFTFTFDARFEERYFDAPDGARIHALHFRQPGARGLVLYHHGNAGSLRGWGMVHPAFTERGYDLLIYDYRGYGKSTGKRTEAGLLADALLIYDRMAGEYPKGAISLYGRSLGTSMASYVASRRNAHRLVLESPYRDFPSLARHHLPWVPAFLVRYRLPLMDYLKTVKCPVYLIHGTDDEIVPYSNSRLLSEYYPVQTRLFTIEGGHHNDLELYEAYERAMDRIFSSDPVEFNLGTRRE
jgi:uncharacterized protein